MIARDTEFATPSAKAPRVKPGQFFLYFDPLHLLPEAGQMRWKDPAEHSKMVQEALDRAQAVARR